MRSGSGFLGDVKIGALGGDLSHAVSLEGEAVGVVDEAVEDGVGDGRIGNDLVPLLDRHLAGDDGRSALVAIVDDFEEIAPLLAGERSEAPIVEDEQVPAAAAGIGSDPATNVSPGIGQPS